MMSSLVRFWSGMSVSALVLVASIAQADTLTGNISEASKDRKSISSPGDSHGVTDGRQPLQRFHPDGYAPEPLQRISTAASGNDSRAINTQGLFEPQHRRSPSGRLGAGEVLTSWPSGQALPWGIGFNLRSQTVWVNDNSAGGGTGLNEEFDIEGFRTGENFTPAFGGSWPADMAFNRTTGMFWQVNVSGDNCIHEWDPSIPAATGNSICGAGWTATSQRGLAYNPNSQTFFIGGWNDSLIYEIDAEGTVVSSCTMNLEVSGLAYNWDEELLFAMVNAATSSIEVIDWATCSIVDSIIVEDDAFPAFAGAGLDIDCDGNLWASNQSDDNIYLIDSGLPADLCVDAIFQDRFEAGPFGIYTDRTEFLKNTAPGGLEPVFNQLGQIPAPLTFNNDDFEISITTSSGGNLFGEPGGIITPNLAADDIVITFTAGSVTAVGANFWSTDIAVNPTGETVTIELSDGTIETYTSTGETDFRGFITELPISSITYRSPGVPGRWATLANLYVGSRP